MKILLEVNDNKAEFALEFLKSISFVKKAKTLTSQKTRVLNDVKEAVKEMKLIKAGKLKARNAEDLINEL